MNAPLRIVRDLRVEALSQLVFEIMKGQSLNVRPLNLMELLMDCEHHELVHALLLHVAGTQDARDSVEKLCIKRLDGSIWHQVRMDYLGSDEE